MQKPTDECKSRLAVVVVVVVAALMADFNCGNQIC